MKLTCPAGAQPFEGECKCINSDEVLENNKCVELICPDNAYPFDGECKCFGYDKVLENNECVPKCRRGQIFENNKCVELMLSTESASADWEKSSRTDGARSRP